VKHDTVGPGDYDIHTSSNLVHKNVTGVVQWKRPETEGKPQPKEKVVPPGPGEYNLVAATQMNSAAKRTGTSVFQSRVARTNLNTAASGTAMSHRSKTK